MLVNLAFTEDGRIATLTTIKGLEVARMLVKGPFKRNAEAVAKGFDETFFSVIAGIGDDEFIDFSRREVCKRSE